MNQQIEKNERENKRRAAIRSAIINVVILILAFLPFLTFPVPPPGEQGILVSFGNVDMGQGDDRPDTQQEEVVPPKPPSEQEEVVQPPAAAEEPDVVHEDPKESVPQEVVTSEDPEAIAMRKKQEEEARQKAEADRKRREAELEKQRQEEEARKQAEAEAQRKAEEEARQKAEYEQAKKQFGDALGKGKGETGKPGNQGDPGGDPDASRLEGISSGSGMVGGGLSNRGVVSEPVIRDNSQKTGRIVVKVCVDSNGDVTSADYTQAGSTTTDSHLKSIAITSAKKFRFSRSSIDKQCGTITIDFKVK
jgi:outer membrane biosynthesis protein TonB